MTQSIFTREPQPCILVRLACPTDGPVRMALPMQDEPPSEYSCPYCLTTVPSSSIGTGQTIRDLPFFHYEGDPLAERKPPSIGSFSRLTAGQLVVLCEEKDILHLASISNIHTSLKFLGPNGIPSISFIHEGDESDPIPHVSASEGVPPYWFLPSEARGVLKPSEQPEPAKQERNTSKNQNNASKSRR